MNLKPLVVLGLLLWSGPAIAEMAGEASRPEEVQCIAPDWSSTVMASGTQQAESIASAPMKSSPSNLKEHVRAILQEHPELIMDVLKQREIELWDLAEQGAKKKAERTEQRRRLTEFENPFHPEVEPGRPIRGNPIASITIVEYSDFECPYCGAVHSTVKNILSQYEGAVRFVYKHNPLDFHPMAEPAARYFEAIALQNHEQAWAFHDRVFEQQDQLQEGEARLKTIVASLDIDQQQFERDLSGNAVELQIVKDQQEAKRFGFDGTPAFLINGVSLRGAYPEEDFIEIIHMFIPNTGHPQSSTNSANP